MQPLQRCAFGTAHNAAALAADLTDAARFEVPAKGEPMSELETQYAEVLDYLGEAELRAPTAPWLT